jgi:hypothetical protein
MGKHPLFIYICRRIKMKRIAFVLGITLLLCAACGSSPKPAVVAQEPDLTGVTSYYVRADGSDTNAGTSEAAPFKTLAKAVQAASKTRVKTITVLGTLVGQTEIKDSGADEILITGKANATGNEKAVITTAPGAAENGINITGNSNIRLEYLTVTGTRLSGIWVKGKNTKLTLGRGVAITGNGKFENSRVRTGGGVLVDDGTLIMQADAAVKGNYALNGGGGVAVGGKGIFIMEDNAVVAENNALKFGGGVYVINGSTLELKNNAVIRGNTAEEDKFDSGGGGIFAYDSDVVMKDNSTVTGNSAPYAGGIHLVVSGLIIAGIDIEDRWENDNNAVYERYVFGNTAAVGWADIKVNNH